MQTTAILNRRAISQQNTSVVLRILNWLVRLDSNHRQSQKLKHLDDRLLDDMGMTRKDAERAFYTKFGRRPADRESIPLQSGSQW